MALPISTSSPKLDRFQQAMESLYGKFVNIKDPENWAPPLRSGGHRGRYLWTDTFGVINLLTMHKQFTIAGGGTDDTRYLALARRLIETVHDVLGRTRDNRSRLPGATDANPLGGGLRIGKTDEHGPDGDGQYHHYLTIWMFALNRMAKASGDMNYNRQAVQLARAIHPKFFVGRSARWPRMIWKMSMDLSTPLVKSEGNLDPIDGFVVFRLLQATAMEAGDGEVLTEEIGDYRRVMDRKGEHFVSSDPLDLDDLFEIDQYLIRNIKFRLAFREFGTSLGLQCQAEQTTMKDRAVDFKNWADSIIATWDPYMELSISEDMTPEDIRPITRVMYASALIPGAFCAGYLGPEPKSMEKR
ncbi:hypothetical protein PENDEC_c008G06690 [Penicillium decumbens]|uniref:Uncharacterized protein n=1 Tax=Penicillium decumbens TaxID=69771 RepID=A0A1V6PF24_PENDC|nr:hypothetical protein PENDEC_c008G06690 [Penicillium decumbens]